MAQDPKTRVRFSERLWSEEVARAEAATRMETAALPFVEEREDAYRFSGRTFKRGRGNPYTD